MGVDGRVVIEESGNEGEEDSNSLVRGDGDDEELLEEFGLLRSIGILIKGGGVSTRSER